MALKALTKGFFLDMKLLWSPGSRHTGHFKKIHLSGENKQFFTRKSLLVLACSNMRSKYPNPTIPREVTTTSVDAIADNQTLCCKKISFAHTKHTDAGIRV